MSKWSRHNRSALSNGNYPIGFDGIEGCEEDIYLFGLNGEVVVDAENESEAKEILMNMSVSEVLENNGIPFYINGIPEGTKRYVFEFHGEVGIESISEVYAEGDFMKMKFSEVLRVGINLY